MRRPRQLCLTLSCVVTAAALPAQRALLDQLPPDADVGPHLEAKFGAELMPIALPGEGSVLGIARIDRVVWVLRGKELHCLDRAGKPRRAFAAVEGMVGLTADDRFLYGLAGKDVHVLDPRAGVSVRTVPLPTDWPPSVIAMLRQQLHVLVDHTLLTVDLVTGTTKRVAQLDDAVQWLASDGQELWAGTSGDCRPLGFAATAPAWRGRRWPDSARESAAAWVDGRLLVALERRGAGGKAALACGFLDTTVDDARSCVGLFVVRQQGKLAFLLDEVPMRSEDELRVTLRRITGGAKPDGPRRYAPKAASALELRPERGITVREVVQLWDLALAAGFTSVQCPGVEAWAREVQRAAPTASGRAEGK